MSSYAFVTGGARNIGAAVARRLTADGFKVIVLDIETPGHSNCEEFLRIDLSDSDRTADEVTRLAKDKRVTCLVNNAGIAAAAALEEIDPDSLDPVIQVNVKAAIVCAKNLVPSMKAAGHGRIINMSSGASLGLARRTVYAASKAALIAMTKSWAIELGKYGITVNAIAPGPIKTSLLDRAYPPGSESAKAMMARIPVKRIGEVDDVADAVAYFASERAGFVTGQVLFVCGGSTLRT